MNNRLKEIEDEIKNMKEVGYSYTDEEMSSLISEKKGILEERERILKIIDEINALWQIKVIQDYSRSTPRDLYIEDCLKDLKQKIKGEDLKCLRE